ncbi:hypothetical protein TOPH_04303 [Tolypocladium ophioglossoides CBS 100239]|uniref:Uncharacterized protein n=1 Tax=Tolypocladium ophioglossoides (strain CBS 100239) TaxID=1163406 RepID=A0A0L0NA87_TOLOC|nr:hypothetical protein TOPH_04303 [Tolypocladium ophioglossoides CBS 100239]
MHGLNFGRSMTQAPYHRPSKSADQVQHIKQLAPQDDTYFSRSASSKSLKSLSWLPAMRRKASKAPVMVRSGNDLHRIVTPLPPVPAALSSSASSLRCSAESRVYNVSGKILANDDSSDAISLGESPVPRATSPPPKRLIQSAMGFYECSADTKDDEALLRPSSAFSHSDLVTMSDQQHNNNSTAATQQEEEWSANVRQLIEETEHAFEAVGNTLSELQLASWLLETPGPAEPSPIVSTYPSTMPLSSVSPSHESQTAGLSRTTPPQKISVPQPPRRQKRQLKLELVTPSKLPAKTTRWTFSASLSNTFLGQRFKRIVADEMLTPARMEELKKGREKVQADARLLLDSRPSNESFQSMSSDKPDTPVEPFHLESLVLRIDASAERSLPPLVEDKDMLSTAPLDQDVVHCDFSLQSSVSKDDAEKEAEETEDSMTIDTFAFPTPPPRNPTRIAPKVSVGLLPTIPEAFAMASDDTQPQLSTSRRSQDGNRDSSENDELVYLNGTILSSANRSFRHGPIACQKPEAGKDDADAEEVDETVDWTAFQMAILGGAGDLVSGMYEDDQNEMADEMAEWFETFGFETHGQLISGGIPSPRNSQDSSGTIDSSSPSSIDSDSDLPIPVVTENPDYYEYSQHSMHGPFSTIKFFRSSSLRRWAADAKPKRYALREPIGARPKPLVVGGDAPEDVSESVAERAPMGCNMEHDLDEFLRWERDNVYCGAI